MEGNDGSMLRLILDEIGTVLIETFQQYILNLKFFGNSLQKVLHV